MDCYGDFEFKIDEFIFVAYDKAEMRNTEIMMMANSA